jgi:Family of unknown function (DUF6069)
MTVPPTYDSYDYGDGRGARAGRGLNAGRLWTGGLATAVVAALVSLLGVLVAEGLFDIRGLGPARPMLLAAGAALLATGLLHLLLVSTPQPLRFFNWIVAMVTLATAIVPFLADASRARQVATSILILVLGLTISSLLSGVARTATRPPACPTR